MARSKSLKILTNAGTAESVWRSAAIAAVGRRMVLFVRQLSIVIRRRRQIAILAKLDDRTLADIGFSPRAVQEAISQPFWARTNGKPFEPGRRWRGSDPSLAALARLDDDQIHNLSEAGQRLRREARRPR